MEVTIYYPRNGRFGKYCMGDKIPSAEELKTDYYPVWEGETHGGSVKAPITHLDVLERLFRMFNSGQNPLAGSLKQVMIKAIDSHTSMSAGDIVKLDGVYYLRQAAGWKKFELQSGSLFGVAGEGG